MPCQKEFIASIDAAVLYAKPICKIDRSILRECTNITGDKTVYAKKGLFPYWEGKR